jgi:hypothetical protein
MIFHFTTRANDACGDWPIAKAELFAGHVPVQYLRDAESNADVRAGL